MKIAFLMTTPFSLGGEQRVTSVVSNILAQRHDVTIICTNNNVKTDYELYNLNKNVNIINIIYKRTFFKRVMLKIRKILKNFNMKTGVFKNNISFLKFVNKNKYLNNEIIETINKNKFDVVIGVAGEYSIILSLIKDSINSTKAIGWQHNCFEAYFKTPKRRFYNQDALSKYMIKKLDKYVVLTNYDRECIDSEFGTQCETIYNPVSFESEIVSKLDKKNFLIAGRLEKVKGHDYLIDSFKYFAEINKEWTLTIVGDGSERESIIEKIKQNNLENRIIMEPTTPDIKSYFLKSSIYLMPSRWEGMPMVILESLEMGVPVISFNISAMKELIENNKEGILIEKYDTKKFADAMLELTSNPDLLKKMGIAAKQRARKFSMEEIDKKWNSLLDNIKGEKNENR